jgi:hypothetical protein
VQKEGEAYIWVEWDWRVEEGAHILYGSSNSGPEIALGIRSLQGTRIQSIDVVGDIPELVVRFSNGQCLRSMAMLDGDPRWNVKLPEKRWISVKRGIVTLSDGSHSEEEGEDVHFALEEQTAARWGVPKAEPSPGRCAECAWFVRIDGDAYLLDYGVCLSSASPFDGRAVSLKSGCPAFTGEEEA